ncbi:Peptidyl-prolyl cis-trans isomerase CYP95 [Glycine max]|nr:Peptidyl-prolyl cis-trans isomerase CYP95 [Glycine max]
MEAARLGSFTSHAFIYKLAYEPSFIISNESFPWLSTRAKTMTKKKNPLVFMDVSIDGDPVERMVFELFYDVAPKTAENFRALCTGEKGISPNTGKSLHYKGSFFHQIIKGSIVQLSGLPALFHLHVSCDNGTAGESIYGSKFPDESPKLKHDATGLLSMAIADRDTLGSHFIITLKADHHLDRKHVVFGKLVQGPNVLKKIEEVGDEEGHPTVTVKIINCGEYSEDGKKVNKSKMGKNKKSSKDRRKRRKYYSSKSGSSSDSDTESSETDSDSESDMSSSSYISSSSDDRRRKRKRSKKDKYRREKRRDKRRDKKRRKKDKRSKRKSKRESGSDSDSESNSDSSSEGEGIGAQHKGLKLKDHSQKNAETRSALVAEKDLPPAHHEKEEVGMLENEEKFSKENGEQRSNGIGGADYGSDRSEERQPDVMDDHSGKTRSRSVSPKRPISKSMSISPRRSARLSKSPSVTPKRRLSKSPSVTPKRRLSKSPSVRSPPPSQRSLSRSPARSISRSPSRSISRSPVRGRNGRSVSRSPVRGRNGRSVSRSPVRVRNGRSVSRSSVRVRNGRSVSRSPVRVRNGRSVSRSPVRGRNWRSVSRSPVRGRNGRSVSRSPARTRSLRSVSKSPVRSHSRSHRSRSSPRAPSGKIISKSPVRVLRKSISRSPVRSPARSLSRSSGRVPSKKSISRSPVRAPSRSNRRSFSRSPSPVHRTRTPRGRSVSRSVSPDASPKRIRRGRGFSERYSYARRYRTPSRSPVRSYRYNGRNDRDRYSTYRRFSPRRFRSPPPRGRTPPRYRSRRSRTPSVSRSPRYRARRYSRSRSPVRSRSLVDRSRPSRVERHASSSRSRSPSKSRSRSRSSVESPPRASRDSRSRSSSRSPDGKQGLVSYGDVSSVSRVVDTITECLSLVQSDSIEVQEKALQTLASITKVSPQNRTMLAQTDNAIPTLASLTNSSSPVIQTLSLLTLFNLSLNPDLKQSLADMETIHYLNSLITSTSSLDSSKLASSLICSLAMHDKNKAKFGVAGTVQLLVKAIEGSHDAHHLLSSLAELVHFHGNCTLAVRAGAVPVLLRVAKGTDNEDLAGTSLAVLSLLARFDEGLNGLKRTDEIVKAMLSVMKGRSLLRLLGDTNMLG